MCSSQHLLAGPPLWSERQTGLYSTWKKSRNYKFKKNTMHPFLWIIWVFCTGFNQEIQIYTVMGTRRGKSICCKVEYNDYRRAQCRRCWEGRAFLYLSRLVSNMFPWLQESCGGGEPDAEQTKRISSPREKTRLWGWITTDGASAIGVKQRQNADDDSANVWRRGSRCHDQQSVSFWLVQKKKKKVTLQTSAFNRQPAFL